MKEYSFNGQRENEEVEMVVKNHPFVLFLPGLKTILCLVLAIALFLFWLNQISGVIAFVLILVGISFSVNSFYNYSQSMFILTTQRVISVEQNGFFKRKIIESEIDRIQDAASSTEGFFKVMLKFGDLVLRTAGASHGSELIVKNIANPYDVQQKVTGILKKKN